VIAGADLFLGLSGPGVLTPAMVARRWPRTHRLCPGQPHAGNPARRGARGRARAIIATGRSDFPNQVNNVLCFPFIFRGALDVGATTINDEMELACIEGIAALARATTSAEAAAAYRGETLSFGPDYLIPKPFDPRLIGVVASAVARAAMETGVATRPIADLDAYKRKAGRLGLQVGPPHAPGVRSSPSPPAASSLPRARTNASCAPPTPCWRKPPTCRS
jgi:malate dehydrogenase (oxaloacetate-decarboxylating)(NADP+)